MAMRCRYCTWSVDGGAALTRKLEVGVLKNRYRSWFGSSGVRVSERADGSQRAGSIQWAAGGQHLEFTIAKKPLPKSAQVPLWFEVLLNSVLSAEARYGTLVHELAHLYCGHSGTPNARWWPDWQDRSHAVREFEAESVSCLVCTRVGIDTASDEYLAAYVRKYPATPPISLDRVMKSVWLLEQTGRAPLGLRRAASQSTSANV